MIKCKTRIGEWFVLNMAKTDDRFVRFCKFTATTFLTPVLPNGPVERSRSQATPNTKITTRQSFHLFLRCAAGRDEAVSRAAVTSWSRSTGATGGASAEPTARRAPKLTNRDSATPAPNRSRSPARDRPRSPERDRPRPPERDRPSCARRRPATERS